MKNRLSWFGYVDRRTVDSVVRGIYQIERSQIIRGRERRPKKTINY